MRTPDTITFEDLGIKFNTQEKADREGGDRVALRPDRKLSAKKDRRNARQVIAAYLNMEDWEQG